MKFKNWGAGILACLVLFACNTEQTETEGTESKYKAVKMDGEAAFDAEMLEIDREIASEGQLLSSFRYSKEDGAMILAHAHLTNEGRIIKIDEEFNDGPGKSYGLNSYYLKGDKPFATRAYFEEVKGGKSMFVERISYYKDGKVQKTKERTAEYEELIEDKQFVGVKPQALSVERAQRIMNQEKEFETLFQGFVEVQAVNYMVLGSAEEDGYTTTVRIERPDQFTYFLLANQEECLNKKVKVSFENVVDRTGFEYQSYLGGGFVNP
ncbi:MAG: hypothetical protein EP338_00535 [Bacteroidetes bacterium]|nr:MAG: hypothetical protein EP338_00535 [Bacteroidota bacterium]